MCISVLIVSKKVVCGVDKVIEVNIAYCSLLLSGKPATLFR